MKTQNKNISDFWCKLVPPEYLYPKNCWRIHTRDGITWKLDISNIVDHNLYFGFKDNSLNNLKSYIDKNSTIIDIGANIGATTLWFAQIATNGKVFSFEPDTRNYQRLKENLELNHSKNIYLIQKGLGDKLASAKLFRVMDKNPGMNRILMNDDNEFPFDEIEVNTLDNELLNFECIPDVVKIDVEGFELKVLKGAEKTIESYKPVLFIELDDSNLKAQGSSAIDLVNWLLEKHYRIYDARDNSPILPDSTLENCHFDILCKM